MSDSASTVQCDLILDRLRRAEAAMEQDEIEDLSDLQTEIANFCARAAKSQSDDAKAALQKALDAIEALEAKMRERHQSVEDRLRSNPNRKRALAAYGRS